MRIAALEHVNDANIKVDTNPLEITLDEAQTLGSALKRFINSTSEDVRACFQAGNYHGCSIRQVESQIAQQMVEALEINGVEIKPNPPISTPPGYVKP